MPDEAPAEQGACAETVLPLAASSCAVPDADVEAESTPALPELPAAAMPEPPAPEVKPQADERQVNLAFGDRRYRVRGLPTQLTEALKVNVLVTLSCRLRGAEKSATPDGAALHVDTLDLYQAKQRQVFAKSAAAELRVDETILQRDLGRLLLRLEQIIEERAKAAESSVAATVSMTAAQTQEALAFLRDEHLIERIMADVERVGLVGEPSNALVALSRLREPQTRCPIGGADPIDERGGEIALDGHGALARAGGGPSALLGDDRAIAVLSWRDGLKAPYPRHRRGRRRAPGGVCLESLAKPRRAHDRLTGKDPATGMLVTQQYRVEGPVMLFLTTTAIDVDEELVNRCLVLTINESREQTRRILARQRSARTLAGLVATSNAESIRKLHQNAQRLLRPLAVVNPYAEDFDVPR